MSQDDPIQSAARTERVFEHLDVRAARHLDLRDLARRIVAATNAQPGTLVAIDPPTDDSILRVRLLVPSSSEGSEK